MDEKVIHGRVDFRQLQEDDCPNQYKNKFETDKSCVLTRSNLTKLFEEQYNCFAPYEPSSDERAFSLMETDKASKASLKTEEPLVLLRMRFSDKAH